MDNSISPKQPFDFSGSIPRHYDQYLGPMFFEPYAVEVASRINPSAIRIALELAAGTGRVTKHLRDILPPSTKLVASDISPDMLAVAKEKLKDANVDWQIIDAQNLPFESESIDLVVCCFGLMFIPDRAKAFSEVHRVLSRHGMFIFTTWDKLEMTGTSALYRSIAKKYLADPLPESYNLPFSMHDVASIEGMLHHACFSETRVEKVLKQSISKTAKDAAEGLTQGGAIYNEIMRRNPQWVDEIKSQVEKQLAEKYGAAPMIAPMSAVIGEAWK